MDALMCVKHWVRPGVFVDVTTVAADVGGSGAFAPPGKVTPKGAFIGAYRAPRWRRGEMTPYKGENDYVFQVGPWRAAPPSNAAADVARFLRASR